MLAGIICKCKGQVVFALPMIGLANCRSARKHLARRQRRTSRHTTETWPRSEQACKCHGLQTFESMPGPCQEFHSYENQEANDSQTRQQCRRVGNF